MSAVSQPQHQTSGPTNPERDVRGSDTVRYTLKRKKSIIQRRPASGFRGTPPAGLFRVTSG
jgi:hypothetical protein